MCGAPPGGQGGGRDTGSWLVSPYSYDNIVKHSPDQGIWTNIVNIPWPDTFLALRKADLENIVSSKLATDEISLSVKVGV